MKRSLGRHWGRRAWACAWLLLGGAAMAQTPEQHWQATPNPSNYPPNYQPSTAPASPPATGNPAAAAPATGQYQNPQQPDQPVGPPQYPTIERRGPALAGQPVYGPEPPPDNRTTYPQQDPRAQGAAGQGPPLAGPPIQGPPVRPQAPQAPFVLSPPEARALENLLTDWEKRNKEIHVLESDFYRWKYDAVFGNGNQPTPEKGILKFAAPDKGLMKIEAKDPKQSEQWLCDGKSIYQFDYPRKLVTEFVMPPELQGKGIGDGPLPFVFGVEAQKLKRRYFMRIITPPRRAKRGLAGGLSALPAAGGRIQSRRGHFANQRQQQGLAALRDPGLFAQRQGPHGLSTAKPVDQSVCVFGRGPPRRLVEAFNPLRVGEEDRVTPTAGASRADSIACTAAVKTGLDHNLANCCDR